MSERVITKEMACNEAGTHMVETDDFFACLACGSEYSAPTDAWKCEGCPRIVTRYRGGGDQQCACGANYNACGQRLRDDYRGNPSMYDSEIGDLEGYEMQHGGDW